MPNNQMNKTATKQNVKKNTKKNSKNNGTTPKAIGVAYKQTSTLRSPMTTSVYSGSDYISTIQLPANLTVGNAALVELPISPSNLAGSRISVLSKCYEKYRFLKLQARFVPSVPTTVGGQCVMYFDMDVGDTYSNAQSVEVMVRDAMAHKGSKMFNVHTPVDVAMPERIGLTDFFTGPVKGENRLYYQSKLFVIGVAGLTGATSGTTIGSIFIDYTIRFEGVQLLV